ncbi:MAG: hypothetical protein JWQ87_2711 [Candidatus Sulfotelmatobacter sp.]|nr:hypothetical protein [Candidatus Sulfotelmatobacter sp.]
MATTTNSTTTSTSKDQGTASSGEKTGGERTVAQVQADLEQQRKQADRRMRPELEAQRNLAQQEAGNVLDRDAIAAIQQTERAVIAIAEDRIGEALDAIEQAAGKIEILLSRNPATALIPVNTQVRVIDTAPQDDGDIALLRNAANTAFDINDLPATRTLLDSLRSEIRVRTYHIPLATYPVALQAAARLLDQKKTRDAGAVLLAALNTLAAIDQVTGIPLMLARNAVVEAQTLAQTDKEGARELLDIADHELGRAMDLGYTPEDADYTALRDEMKNLRKQLKGSEDTTSVFARVKEKLASLTRRQQQKQTSSATPASGKKAEQERKAA